LPAHTVIIKGTQLYDSERGGFVDIGMSDILQIFGRAGRPGFDLSGLAYLITDHEKMQKYLALLTNQLPIESQFIKALPDHLNAEIILGSVSNVKEAIQWLTYTFLYTRMIRNPIAYGITYEEKSVDPHLSLKRQNIIIEAAKTLMRCRMIKFDPSSGNLYSTDVGRIASHYYLHHDSIEVYNGLLKSRMSDEEILNCLANSKEFQQIKVREEELQEMEKLAKKYAPIKIKHPLDSTLGKANLLLQCYISKASIDNPTLISDSYFISQSAARISRALFEMILKRGLAHLANRLLLFTLMIEKQIWDFQSPLRQFLPNLRLDSILKLEEKDLTVERLVELEANEIGAIIRQNKIGGDILHYALTLPYLTIDTKVHPITRQILNIELSITSEFNWNPRYSGSVEPFHIWIEDGNNERIYHAEYFLLQREQASQVQKLSFTIPIEDPLPPQYYIKCVSDRWLASEFVDTISFQHLILPMNKPIQTNLLNLQPLPKSALMNEAAEAMYSFSHFNPIQTQIFHSLYHNDNNILLGAPTGSGKTVIAELAMLRLFATAPQKKIIYIAPMKALVRERMNDWTAANSFAGRMKKRIVELTGDSLAEAADLNSADIIISTPEKFDGVSRDWKHRSYIQSIGLVIIDEIHLLASDRGAVLEVLVSRMRYIAEQNKELVRIVGLSTALANAEDVADWLGITNSNGLYNFPPSMRPVELSIHIRGFPGKNYCPRMQTMNRPAYAAIQTYSINKPVLIFVSSRRQTRLTSLDLISFTAADGNPRKFLNVQQQELDSILDSLEDNNLKHMISFGIGIHHAGLSSNDRNIVEKLFLQLKIQVLVCTATLAWYYLQLSLGCFIQQFVQLFDTNRLLSFARVCWSC
jgi:activating signal cointegrator complex subunit 3